MVALVLAFVIALMFFTFVLALVLAFVVAVAVALAVIVVSATAAAFFSGSCALLLEERLVSLEPFCDGFIETLAGHSRAGDCIDCVLLSFRSAALDDAERLLI